MNIGYAGGLAESFKNCTLDLIDAVKNNREPVLSGEQGREVLKFALCTMGVI